MSVLYVFFTNVIIIFLVGLIGNIVSIRLWSKGNSCTSLPYARYFYYLSVADLLMLLLNLFPSYLGAITPINLYTVNDFLCPTLIFAYWYCFLLPIWIMVCVLLDRSLCSLCPARWKPENTTTRARVVLVALLVLLALVCSPYILFSERSRGQSPAFPGGYGRDGRTFNDTGLYSTYRYGLEDHLDSLNYPDYVELPYECIFPTGEKISIITGTTMFVLQKILPVPLAVLCVVGLAISLCRSTQSRTLTTMHSPTNRRITWTICVLGIIFITVRSLDYLLEGLGPIVGQLPYVGAVSSCFVYCILPAYRHDLKAMFTCCCSSDRHDVNTDQERVELN